MVVWYHGGGLTSGQKEIPELLKKQGFVVVGVNYRLLPKVKIDECLDDCAASLAWVFSKISVNMVEMQRKYLFRDILPAAILQPC